MPEPQFFDIQSSQFQEVTPTGNEEIQVGATQKVKLNAIAALVDLASKTLSGMNIPTPFANVSKVATTDSLLTAFAKLIAFTSNGYYRTLVGRIDNQYTVAIYSYDKDAQNKLLYSMVLQMQGNNLVVGTLGSTGSGSGSINPETYPTDQALLEALYTNSTKRTFVSGPQEVPGNQVYTITSDSSSVGLNVQGNMNYILQKSSAVTIATGKSIELNPANFGTGKENTLICIPTSLVSSAIRFTFSVTSGSIYAGPGFTKSSSTIYHDLDPTKGSVLVVAIQYVANLGFALNCAYYA